MHSRLPSKQSPLVLVRMEQSLSFPINRLLLVQYSKY
ncbi:unnamed protein product [Amoebophrya sp. A25]|nr:unnamed protein product [Amoebophrya sp. A25]|eukprot:GSA25T00021911001.1